MEPTSSNVDFSERPSSFEPARPPKNRKKLIGIVAIILVILGLIMLGLRNSQGNGADDISPTPTIEEFPTEEPLEESPTPEEEEGSITPTRSAVTPTRRPTTGAVSSAKDLNVRVANGSGTAGVAGEGRTYLADKGYKNLDTGNAENFDFTGVTVRIKSSRKTFADALIADLKGKYTVNSEVGTLPDTSDFDAEVIIGK